MPQADYPTTIEEFRELARNVIPPQPTRKAVCPKCQKRHEGNFPCNMAPDLVTHPSGATSSKLDAEFTSCPLKAMREVARVMTRGAQVHGRDNWRKGLPEHVNADHALAHIFNALEGIGDKREEVGHAAARLLMWLETLV